MSKSRKYYFLRKLYAFNISFDKTVLAMHQSNII